MFASTGRVVEHVGVGGREHVRVANPQQAHQARGDIMPFRG